MIHWIKTLFRIVRTFDNELITNNAQHSLMCNHLDSLTKIIRDRTEIHADIPNFSGYPCTIIVCGQYKNSDFVQIYQVPSNEFSSIIDHLKQLNKFAKVKTVDSGFQIKSYIKHELGEF